MSDAGTSKSTFSGPVVVDPLTRIEGHLRIEVEVQNGVVKDARSCGTLFRGLELILRGRDPRDAQHFTQRTCGVCTFTHALASTRALEDAVKAEIPKNATYIRNLVLGMVFLHDHIVHFYHLHALDFVDVAAALKADPAKTADLAASISPRPAKAEDFKAVRDKLNAFVDSGRLGPFTNAYFLGGHPAYRLEPEANLLATAHYLEALRLQVNTAKATAVFGAKNPHMQFLAAGGVTCYNALKRENINEFTALYKETRAFVEEVYIPDLLLVAGAYKDWAGIGGTDNFMAFGEFPVDERRLESRRFKPGVFYKRRFEKPETFKPAKIAEHVRHSWFEGSKARRPFEGETRPAFTRIGDTDRYSWSKAPRYGDAVMETGPLAHVLVNYARGDAATKALTDAVLTKLNLPPSALFSTLGRTAARGIETAVIARSIETWLEEYADNIVKGDAEIINPHDVPDKAEGVGFVGAPRGGLSHWLRIEDKKIANFQLVVPSTWNLGPRCGNDKMSAVEQALVGTPIADPKRPVEILRTVHSFDPCLACAVHVIDGASNEVHVVRAV
jgi:[NiFe] hydrogenase large subunit